jgi:hypothetical protein
MPSQPSKAAIEMRKERVCQSRYPYEYTLLGRQWCSHKENEEKKKDEVGMLEGHSFRTGTYCFVGRPGWAVWGEDSWPLYLSYLSRAQKQQMHIRDASSSSCWVFHLDACLLQCGSVTPLDLPH